MADSEFFRKYADIICEAEGQPSRHALQIRTQEVLIRNFAAAEVQFNPSSELTPYETYPRLGITPVPGEPTAWYCVSADPAPDGSTAQIMMDIDVQTSNNLYRSENPGLVARITAGAEQIASKMGGMVIPYSNSHAPHQHMAPKIKIDELSLAQKPAQQISTPATQSSYSRQDPLSRFLNTPGERAKQSRVRTSAYSDSFGGDSSNYRNY